MTKQTTSTTVLSRCESPSPQTHSSPSVVIQASQSLFSLDLHVLWDYRELLYFLTWRDVKARYAQMAIGVSWVVLQPLITLMIFTVVFSKLANLPSDGLPYPLFAYSALVPWAYFARSFERSGFSVVAESNLIKKVYFPRIIIPLSATLGGLLDFGIAFILLLAMMAWYGIAPTWGVLFIPLFLLMTIASTLAVSLWLSAIFVTYRDIGAVIPVLTQLWMFASPVVYPVSVIPEKWRLLYSLNPMVGVIEGFRWALIGKATPDFAAMAMSMAIIFTLLIFAIAFFNRVARTFADVA